MVRGDTTASKVFSFVGTCAREGHAFYRAVAKHLSDPDVKALFLQLATDELEHMHTIEKMADRPDEHLASDESSLVARYVERIVDNEIVRPASAARRMTGTIGGLVEALDLGIKAEERGVELYTRALREAPSKTAAEAFRFLLEMEKRHLMLLSELRKRLTTEPPKEG